MKMELEPLRRPRQAVDVGRVNHYRLVYDDNTGEMAAFPTAPTWSAV